MYIIIFLKNNILNLNIYFFINKNNINIVVAFKLFFDKIKYNNYRYTRFYSNYNIKY